MGRDSHNLTFRSLSQFIHHHLLWFLIGAYTLSAIWPTAGLWIRHISFGDLRIVNETLHVSFLLLLLATLMFNAGLGVKSSHLRSLAKKTGALSGAHRQSDHPHGLYLSGHPHHAAVV